MANKVFANGLEVSCKVAKGKSVAAFPDPCWAPPPPPSGPIVLPFPNTAYAKHMTKGSKSVQISGNEVMLKDKSYFKKSTGNEAATQAFQKGVISRKLKGKVYFSSFSMNVMVEGDNVVRHTDITTHNHGSGANEYNWPYFDSQETISACKGSLEKIDDSCENDEKGDWKEHHCQNFKYKPNYRVKKELEDILSLDDEEVVKQQLVQRMYANDNDEDMLKDILDNKDKPKSKTLSKARGRATRSRADNMAEEANKEECLRARKCMLVPYKEKNKKKRKEFSCCHGQTGHHLFPHSWALKTCDGYTEADHSSAPVVCSEGTSHSLGGTHQKLHENLDKELEKSIKETLTKESGVASMSDFSNFSDEIRDSNRKSTLEKTNISYEQSQKMAIDSLLETFPDSDCNEGCIKAQLNTFFNDKKCNNNSQNAADMPTSRGTMDKYSINKYSSKTDGK